MGYPNVLNYGLEDFDVPGRIFDRGTLFFQNEQLKEKCEVGGNLPRFARRYYFAWRNIGVSADSMPVANQTH